MRVVALTGGIGAGKSTVGKKLAELGAVRVDADDLARRALAPGSAGLARVRELFGDAVFTAAGELDRAALGQIVFADANARKQLEGIVHPAVQELFASEVAAAREAGAAILVYEIPLLAENHAKGDPAVVSPLWDTVVTVEADPELRHARLLAHRGMSPAAARARIASQASREEREALADYVIETAGTEEETLAAAQQLWQILTS